MSNANARLSAPRSVFMGDIDLANRSDRINMILGSCVGIVLVDPIRKLAALAHVMLPEWKGGLLDQPGKYANTAVPALLGLLKMSALEAPRLVATVAGGANMFGSPKSYDVDIPHVGQSNIEQVKAALGRLKIPITREETGGYSGRKIELTENLALTISLIVRASSG